MIIGTMPRSSGIGGSDAAAVVGLSPWKTPYQLWLEKTKAVEEDSKSTSKNNYLSEAAHFGNILEPIVAGEFKRRNADRRFDVMEEPKTIKHPHRPWMLANIDRWVTRIGSDVPRTGLECKTASAYLTKEWGLHEEDVEAPQHYLIQCIHYMEVTGYPDWFLAVLIGGNTYRQYQIVRHLEIAENLVQREEYFWKHHVLGDNPPTASDIKDLTLMYGDGIFGKEIQASEEVTKWAHHLIFLKSELAKFKEEIDDVEFEIKRYMGDATELLDKNDTRLLTWRSHGVSRVDVKRLRAELPETARKYSNDSTVRSLRTRKGD